MVHERKLADAFEIRTGGKDCRFCLSSYCLDNRLRHVNIDSVEAKWHPVDPFTDAVRSLGLCWWPGPSLHTQIQLQEKTRAVADTSASLGLNIHREKSKLLQVNAAKNYDNERDSSLQKMTSFKGAGDGSVKLSPSLHPVSQGKLVLAWNPQKRRKKGPPRNTWCRP